MAGNHLATINLKQTSEAYKPSRDPPRRYKLNKTSQNSKRKKHKTGNKNIKSIEKIKKK